ncbi:DMT family transporter [Robertmurraya kyonggiensis]|uniref:Multidrug efflux SMR transporter n=1 Tax=Robertmurraya kyonggiensis TaxID=1037680 RepID=A0A4U1D233_9BACI|nr:multidrug efflux SMR transporter [Robertmurraya kyonggiensis]TKC16385.1 multidrug efflux SMR transporter [Robertmurraya kyonggiensis]
MFEWTLLIIAGLFEVIGVIGIKRTVEENNLLNNILLYGGFIISFQILIQVMEWIPLATAYAVWTGIGTVGAAIVGMIFFQESRNPFRLLCILGVIGAVTMLKFLE